MQVTVKAKHLTLTDALKEYARSKLSRLQKYFDHLLSADVTLTTERNFHVVDVTVHANGVTLRGEERSDNMYSSIDQVIDKLERQVRKRKEKLKEHHKSNGKAIPVPVEIAPEARMIFVRKHVPTVTPEEAAAKLEEKGCNFLLFRNADSSEMNVIYRREDGSLAVLEPIL